jgi:SnoaL-like domain
MYPLFEIQQTLYRYAWCWDFELARGIGDCFTEDVVGDFGNVSDELVTHGRDEMVIELERLRMLLADELNMHAVTNTHIKTVSVDEVRATSYCQFYVKQTGAENWDRRTGGYYDDIFVPVDDRWLIKRRCWMFGSRC